MPLLPNADRAVIDRAKLRDYSLNPNHPTGAHKARVLAASLGLSPANVEVLHDTVRAAALSQPAVSGKLDEYGHRYVVDLVMQRAGRQATVRSTWIIRIGEDFPRLTSCYVL